MSKELEKNYNPGEIEGRLYDKWLMKKYFHAEVNRDKKPFTIVMPPPNITGKLHMGHALDNTLQDILIRYKRMQGFETLWIPGTDHASISTEVKVINALKEEGIDIEFIWIPSPDSWKRERSNTVSDYAKENGIKFTDLNLNYKDFKLDFKEDTCDEGDHLNVYGATKVSNYLGKYINDNYKFDKHDEKLIARWNKDLETYKNDIKELEKLGK